MLKIEQIQHTNTFRMTLLSVVFFFVFQLGSRCVIFCHIWLYFVQAIGISRNLAAAYQVPKQVQNTSSATAKVFILLLVLLFSFLYYTFSRKVLR